MNKPRLPFDIEFLVENILSEDPDSVYDTNYVKKAIWYDGGITFMIFNTFSIIAVETTHNDMVEYLQNVSVSENPRKQLEIFLGRQYFKVSSIDNAIKELGNGKFSKYLKGGIGAIGDADEFRLKFGLTGRIWPEKKIISFWNPSKKVIDKWDTLEKMFSDFPELGTLNKYQVDFIERSRDRSKPMTSAEEITSSRGTDKKTNFIEKLTPNEMKVVRQKIHVMEPVAKREFLMAFGLDANTSHVAEKLGMSVAEYNHIMNINERVEAKMPTLLDITKQLRKL